MNDLAIGEIVYDQDGRSYELVAHIGGGGQGRIYTTTKSDVLVKGLQPLFSEPRRVGSTRSPNAVRWPVRDPSHEHPREPAGLHTEVSERHDRRP